MNRDTAAAMCQSLLEAGKNLNAAIAVAQAGCAQDEFVAIRKSIAKPLADIYLEVLKPLFVQFPDLKPPELGSAWGPVDGR
jgi:hypothetical protein